jgi:BlaI family transcriptional regulator, penicillinase repressor
LAILERRIIVTVNDPLSAREREILDLVYRLGQATATQVIAAMKQPPSRSAVRTFLKILEDKGYLKHKKEGREYVFVATRSRASVGLKAVRHVLETFFGGSISNAVASYLAKPGQEIDSEELNKLEELIDAARNAEKKQ